MLQLPKIFPQVIIARIQNGYERTVISSALLPSSPQLKDQLTSERLSLVLMPLYLKAAISSGCQLVEKFMRKIK